MKKLEKLRILDGTSLKLIAMISMVFSWHHTGMKQTPEEMRDLADSILKFPEEIPSV